MMLLLLQRDKYVAILSQNHSKATISYNFPHLVTSHHQYDFSPPQVSLLQLQAHALLKPRRPL